MRAERRLSEWSAVVPRMLSRMETNSGNCCAARRMNFDSNSRSIELHEHRVAAAFLLVLIALEELFGFGIRELAGELAADCEEAVRDRAAEHHPADDVNRRLVLPREL